MHVPAGIVIPWSWVVIHVVHYTAVACTHGILWRFRPDCLHLGVVAARLGISIDFFFGCCTRDGHTMLIMLLLWGILRGGRGMLHLMIDLRPF